MPNERMPAVLGNTAEAGEGACAKRRKRAAHVAILRPAAEPAIPPPVPEGGTQEYAYGGRGGGGFAEGGD